MDPYINGCVTFCALEESTEYKPLLYVFVSDPFHRRIDHGPLVGVGMDQVGLEATLICQ